MSGQRRDFGSLGRLPKSVGLYIHVPFCRAKCAYCDFNSYPGLEPLFDGYVRALVAEMAQAGQGMPADTVYIGGGTPTVLPLSLLAGVLDAVGARFSLPDGVEITVEANPGTVDAAGLAGLRAAGVNRLSLGVQSFDDGELQLLGRIHTAVEAREAFRLAREAGYANLNLDLIFGLPGQTVARWQATLEQAVALAPEHLSLYALSVEEGTPLAGRIAAGEWPPPDDDLAADMYELAEERLAAAGYGHYEISNWARPGHECGHNLTYWRNRPYLGLGAGAHSWLGGRRWRNVRSPQEYVRRLGRGQSPVAESETIGRALEMGETMMMGLRLLREGVGRADFEARFGVGLGEVYGPQLADLSALGLVEAGAERVRLTARGRLLGNRVFGRFLPDVTAP